MVSVDEWVLLSAEWLKGGVEVTTGTATVEIVSTNAGTAQWLDSDLSSQTTTRTTLALTYDADEKWARHLQVPESLRGRVFDAWYRHSDSELPPMSEQFEVSSGPGDGGHLTVTID